MYKINNKISICSEKTPIFFFFLQKKLRAETLKIKLKRTGLYQNITYFKLNYTITPRYSHTKFR